MNFFAQATDSIWAKDSGSGELYAFLTLGIILGLAFVFACMFAPVRARRWIIATVTFLGGAFWVLRYFWPEPPLRGSNDIPQGMFEGVGFWIRDAVPIVGNFANIISGFMLGLGTYSLGRIHSKRLFSGHKDAFFSALLLIAMFAMLGFSLADWSARQADTQNKLGDPANWQFVQYARDVLFDGLYMVMDSVMFSLIAFFILSAAYRAFRLRSIEATILLVTAVILMISLMGHFMSLSSEYVTEIAKNSGQDPNGFMSNLKPKTWTDWLVTFVQTPGIRAVDLGLGVGTLAMGLRLWLNLERGVGSA